MFVLLYLVHLVYWCLLYLMRRSPFQRSNGAPLHTSPPTFTHVSAVRLPGCRPMPTSCLSLSFPSPSIFCIRFICWKAFRQSSSPWHHQQWCDEHEGQVSLWNNSFYFFWISIHQCGCWEQKAHLFSVFRRTATLFPTMATLLTLLPGKSLLSHMLSSTLALWWSLSSYYNRCEGNLKILICILQKISNAKHAFRCMSSLEECPFRSFVLPSYLPSFLPSLTTFSSPLLLLSHSLSFFLAIKSPVLITHACNPSPRRLRQGITNWRGV